MMIMIVMMVTMAQIWKVGRQLHWTDIIGCLIIHVVTRTCIDTLKHSDLLWHIVASCVCGDSSDFLFITLSLSVMINLLFLTLSHSDNFPCSFVLCNWTLTIKCDACTDLLRLLFPLSRCALYAAVQALVDICHYFHTQAFWGLKILHSKLRKLIIKSLM